MWTNLLYMYYRSIQDVRLSVHHQHHLIIHIKEDLYRDLTVELSLHEFRGGAWLTDLHPVKLHPDTLRR